MVVQIESKLTSNNMKLDKVKITVFGQGYVGLPLTLNFECLKNDSNIVVYDLKEFLPKNQVNSRL